jgi:hypothetical protein
MKTLQRILPVIAIVAVLGGAIYYVQSNAPHHAEAAEAAKAPAPAKSLVPPSDRYGADSTPAH